MWADAIGNAGEAGEKGLVGFGDASVVGLGAVGFDGEGGEMEALFEEARQGGEVGADDGGDGGADEGEEREGAAGGLEGLGSGGEFLEELMASMSRRAALRTMLAEEGTWSRRSFVVAVRWGLSTKSTLALASLASLKDFL